MSNRAGFCKIDEHTSDEFGSWSGLYAYATTFLYKSGALLAYGGKDFDEEGIYILTSGVLRKSPEIGGLSHDVDAKEFPVIYASIAHERVLIETRYKVVSDYAVLLRVKREGLADMYGGYFDILVDNFRKHMIRNFQFDVFLSYANEDLALVNQLDECLTRRGIRVYINRRQSSGRFQEEIEGAIKDSLVFVPIITAVETLKQMRDKASWVERECSFRQQIFDRDSANIVPVRFVPDRGRDILDGVSEIVGQIGNEDSVAEELVGIIQRIAAGATPIPFAKDVRNLKERPSHQVENSITVPTRSPRQ